MPSLTVDPRAGRDLVWSAADHDQMGAGTTDEREVCIGREDRNGVRESVRCDVAPLRPRKNPSSPASCHRCGGCVSSWQPCSRGSTRPRSARERRPRLSSVTTGPQIATSPASRSRSTTSDSGRRPRKKSTQPDVSTRISAGSPRDRARNAPSRARPGAPIAWPGAPARADPRRS